jgi:uncharacterized protein (TIGR03083 family)
MGDEPMTRERMLMLLRAARAAWDALLDSIPRGRMAEPMMGDWSIKDIVAHVTWGEREMIPVMRERALRGSELWNLPQDERNRRVVAESWDRPLEDVLTEHREVYAALVAEVEKLSDEDLTDPSRYENMPAEWTLWQLIAGNTFDHYPEHAGPIREWLEG